jgi:hypothetical protein
MELDGFDRGDRCPEQPTLKRLRRAPGAFSSELAAGSREENASEQEASALSQTR